MPEVEGRVRVRVAVLSVFGGRLSVELLQDYVVVVPAAEYVLGAQLRNVGGEMGLPETMTAVIESSLSVTFHQLQAAFEERGPDIDVVAYVQKAIENPFGSLCIVSETQKTLDPARVTFEWTNDMDEVQSNFLRSWREACEEFPRFLQLRRYYLTTDGDLESPEPALV
ncbi:MAG: hypothetical protein JSS66_09195 [Armatimonadetes bacterium]|nr:hypothetical protein [Armatimonadota bacterium]